jgi:hypothetical protein
MVERTATTESGWDAIARGEWGVPAATFTVGELEELPYADASFGVVTGFNSFQYAAAGEEAVRAGILEALAPFRTRDGGYRLENMFCYVVAGA